ncbi:MAG TPA: hypothetical protein VIY54_10800 [Steroidobacteraceae bacterium]
MKPWVRKSAGLPLAAGLLLPLAAGLLLPCLARATDLNSTTPPTAQSPSLPPQAPTASSSDDRIALSGDGSALTGTNGGGGGSLSWLHNFNADTLASVAAEHQVLGVSHWTFGSLAGALTVGPAEQRYTFSGEAHEGAGDDGTRAFKYGVEALSVTGTYFHRVSAQLEDRQIDVETTHGNLPKVGLTYVWNPHLQTAVAYQYSVSGNLGTRLASARIDLLGSVVHLLAGGAWGQASPSVLGFGFTLPARHLTEGYVGLAKPFPHLRSELTLIADYQRIAGGAGFQGPNNTLFNVPNSTRWTGTLNYVFHIGHTGQAH